MCKDFTHKDSDISADHLKATDWLSLPSTCFLLGMIAGILVIAVLDMIFIYGYILY